MVQTALILAAGLGSRLKHHTSEIPKGFLRVGEETLIERSLRLLYAQGILRVIIGTGYRSAFYDDLKKKYAPVVTWKNEIFDQTGSFYTLYNMRDLVHGDFLLLESDLLYEERALTHLLENPGKDIILASGKTASGDEVYIETDSQGMLVRMSKKRNELGTISGELVGVSKISLPTFHRLISLYEGREEEARKIEYESALVCLSAHLPIKVDVAPDLIWTEIDTEAHLDRARHTILPIISQKEEPLGNKKAPLAVRRNILLNPGPATTTDTVKLAQVVPDICPREKSFTEIMHRVSKSLVRVVNGDERHGAVLFTASGTGGVEALISSVVPESGRLLVVNNGAYGERIYQVARIYYSEERVIHYKIPYGGYPDLSAIEGLIRKNPGVTHIAVVHHETTTGMLNPVVDIAKIAHASGIEMIVDAISSYAGIDIDIERDGFDYLVSTSNKNIQGMAGIAFVITSIERLEKLSGHPRRNLYFNLYDQYQSFKKSGQMQFTPAVQVIYALNQALTEFFSETPENRYRRYRASFTRLTDGLRSLGFTLFLPPEQQAGLITSIYNPDHPAYRFEAMHDYLYERGYTIYPGKIGGVDTFRVANIGAIDEADIHYFLIELNRYLEQNGIQLSGKPGIR
jgi:2-aminoethylphosphonate-pyruvate transaminase